MIGLSLAEIADAVSGVLHTGGSALTADSVVSGPVHTDSRNIEAGAIFVAKPGEVTDGHLFAPQAVDRGASLLIVERHLDLPVAQVVVPDVVVALGALAADVVTRVRALGRLKVVGVTGSNGKTTTKNLLGAVLERVGPTVAARGSFNNWVGAPMTMLEVTDDTRFLVVEMGASGSGSILRLVRLARPDIGIVLSVGLAHAGEFGGIEATADTKAEMVTELLGTDVAVLNADDPRVAGMAAKTRADIVWFGQGPTATVRASDLHASASGTTFVLQLASGESRTVSFRVLGEHHVMNALAAAAAAERLGVGIDDIVAGLESVARAERWRMEVLGGRDGVTIINDAYNASPDSMSAALKTLAQIREPGMRTVAVLGEMAELGELAGEEHDRIGLLAVRLNISQIVVVGTAARRMHISTINEGSWDGESTFVDTADAAFELLRDSLQPGDTVLVKSSKSAGLRFLGDRLGDLFS
ncbi:UDP-N-acetylmuramoyl-tripeptide--D-alanyl-D-alanine ligase [Cryobacterium tagatosivorans]|uniref:UDP-N-acetylmuramoyl-tripeptide--D-alanyl-D-alanine ligase n=1 Tax=Cryobacterium tagatosivorans TaxID=1259199 RepID=A0A4R8UH29_9MICO|nr:UDP-N-acetylmuramoyl-tripeptide--D-alanyl-D-alanine ligase [Cryobacterium tagatosivorans]TFB52015.1 UDP-N-acetylmuramoyl-tripeptide--D-alanyl-D-alanine ligase [Cryobacterium tagatosivorans]